MRHDDIAGFVGGRVAYAVVSVPFWRWAVALKERPDLPAVAFYRRASAEVFADECRNRFPARTTQLLRRVFGGVEVFEPELGIKDDGSCRCGLEGMHPLTLKCGPRTAPPTIPSE